MTWRARICSCDTLSGEHRPWCEQFDPISPMERHAQSLLDENKAQRDRIARLEDELQEARDLIRRISNTCSDELISYDGAVDAVRYMIQEYVRETGALPR